jgi:hypothetical protein
MKLSKLRADAVQPPLVGTSPLPGSSVAGTPPTLRAVGEIVVVAGTQ